MPGPKEFREFARECISRAGENRDEGSRELFIQLAKYWMRRALMLERSILIVEDDTSLVPKEDAG
jgi:hypothetical protein